MLDSEFNGLLAQQIQSVDVELFLNEISAWRAEDLSEAVTQTLDTVMDIFYESCNFEVMV